MGEPFIGEIRIFPYNFAPRGWAFCNGTILNINQHSTLYSVIGDTYGGDGRSNFALPNFKGKAPMNWGNDRLGSHYTIGANGGSEYVQLTSNEVPVHSHRLVATTNIADVQNADNPSMLAKTSSRFGEKNTYADASENNPTKLQMNTRAMTTVGNNQAHENRQPSLVLNFCIALRGIYPSRT